VIPLGSGIWSTVVPLWYALFRRLDEVRALGLTAVRLLHGTGRHGRRECRERMVDPWLQPSWKCESERRRMKSQEHALEFPLKVRANTSTNAEDSELGRPDPSTHRLSPMLGLISRLAGRWEGLAVPGMERMWKGGPGAPSDRADAFGLNCTELVGGRRAALRLPEPHGRELALRSA